MTPLFLSRKGLLCLRELFLCLAEVARVLDEFTSGERGKMGHAQVNAYILIAHRQRFGLADLAGKASVPVRSFAFDGEGFDGPCHISLQMQFDGADFAAM